MSEDRPDAAAEGAEGERDLAATLDPLAVIEAYRDLLASPAYDRSVDLAVLTKLAADESVPARERLRAAEVLLKYRMQALEALAHLEGVREQILRDLGIDTNPRVEMTQFNQRIEIVRADDWRKAPPLEQGDVVDVLPEGTEPVSEDPDTDDAEPTHETNGHGNGAS